MALASTSCAAAALGAPRASSGRIHPNGDEGLAAPHNDWSATICSVPSSCDEHNEHLRRRDQGQALRVR
jgi:hypothetical protein